MYDTTLIPQDTGKQLIKAEENKQIQPAKKESNSTWSTWTEIILER